MANNVFGIDLGTSNIKIYNRADDSVMVEKNMIAIENKKTFFAYGDSAFDMYEKAPANIHISYPLCNGVIADIKNIVAAIYPKIFLNTQLFSIYSAYTLFRYFLLFFSKAISAQPPLVHIRRLGKDHAQHQMPHQ